MLHGPDCDQSTLDPKLEDESQTLDLNIKEEDVDNFMYLSEYSYQIQYWACWDQ